MIVIKDTPTAEKMMLVIKNTLLGPVLREILGYAEQLLANTEQDTRCGGNVFSTNVRREKWNGKTRNVTRLIKEKCLKCVLLMRGERWCWRTMLSPARW